MLVAVGVWVTCPGTALGVAVGRDDPSAVVVGEGGCRTMDVGPVSGVLVGGEVAVGKVVGVEVGNVVDVDDGVAVGASVGVAVGTLVGVEAAVAVGVDVGVSVGADVEVAVGEGPGVAATGP